MNRKIILLVLCFALLLASAEPTGIDEKRVTGPMIQTPGKYLDVQKPSIHGRYLKGTKGVLWAQIPDTNTANGVLSQLDSVYPFDCDLVDDIISEGYGWVIDSVTTWWYNWNGFRNWGHVPYIHFMVYADSGIATPHPVDSPFVNIVVPQSNYTATMFASDTARFRVDMELPSPVILPGGQRFWIEVQPANVDAINGRAGWQFQVGIGNAQEFYIRVPELGLDPWYDATSAIGTPSEVGFILYGSPLAPDILFVDDDDGDGLDTLFENSLNNLSISYTKWCVTDSGEVTPDSVDMANFNIVIWNTGEDYSYTLVGDDSTQIGKYLNGGGKMWLSSQDVLWDIGPVSWMHVGSYVSDVGCDTATGVGPVMSGISFPTTGGVIYDYADEINPDVSCWTEMQNETPVNNTIAMSPAMGLPYYLFFNGFAFENIDNVADRDTMMARIINWFNTPPPSTDVGVVSIDEPGSQIPPNTPFTPTATYKNFGDSTVTFDAHYHIDSAGINVYSQAVSFTLTPGDDTTHAFTDYISGGIGVTYNIYAHTILAGDENPANDMLMMTTTVSTWIIETYMPQSLMDQAVVFDGSDIYILGGYNGTNSLDSLFIYKTSKGTWSRGASMPVDLCMYDACVLGDTIYVPGGYSYGIGSIQDNLYKYSISGNNWVTSAGTGEPAWFYACIAVDGKVYRIGGLDNSTSTVWASTWQYTPGAGWTKMTNMPTPTELAVRWARNDTIYIAGGHDGIASPRYVTQFYDAINDIWTQDSTLFAYLPNTLWGAGSAVYKDTVYVMAGVHGVVGQTDSVWYYDYYTNSWNSYPVLIRSVYRADGVGVQGTGFDGIYLFGGTDGSFNPIAEAQRSKMPPAGIDEYIEEVRDYLSIPMGIGKGSISFTFKGEVSKNVIVVDITGRIVKRYDNIRPGTTLNFGGNDIASGIYFLSVEGERNSTQKVTLIR
jgi:hypothetical protein